MTDDALAGTGNRTKERQPYRVRLPGFVSEEGIGLGDTVKQTTSLFGIRACGGCERRAATLNRWLVFSGRHSG
jgi:hypothetical protein